MSELSMQRPTLKLPPLARRFDHELPRFRQGKKPGSHRTVHDRGDLSMILRYAVPYSIFCLTKEV